jgi:hypothetical protein
MFCDVNNQAAVFGLSDESALLRLTEFGHLLILPTNRRNTRPIAEETTMLTRPKVRAEAPLQGIPVRYSWYDRLESQPQILARILRSLLSEEVKASQITVISPRKPEDCCASSVTDPHMMQLIKQNVWSIMTGDYNSISYTSVSAFKGLENDFVVLTDIEELSTEWWRPVIYVGMSRARVGLHILLKESLRPTYESRLREWLEENKT